MGWEGCGHNFLSFVAHLLIPCARAPESKLSENDQDSSSLYVPSTFPLNPGVSAQVDRSGPVKAVSPPSWSNASRLHFQAFLWIQTGEALCLILPKSSLFPERALLPPDHPTLWGLQAKEELRVGLEKTGTSLSCTCPRYKHEKLLCTGRLIPSRGRRIVSASKGPPDLGVQSSPLYPCLHRCLHLTLKVVLPHTWFALTQA